MRSSWIDLAHKPRRVDSVHTREFCGRSLNRRLRELEADEIARANEKIASKLASVKSMQSSQYRQRSQQTRTAFNGGRRRSVRNAIFDQVLRLKGFVVRASIIANDAPISSLCIRLEDSSGQRFGLDLEKEQAAAVLGIAPELLDPTSASIDVVQEALRQLVLRIRPVRRDEMSKNQSARDSTRLPTIVSDRPPPALLPERSSTSLPSTSTRESERANGNSAVQRAPPPRPIFPIKTPRQRIVSQRSSSRQLNAS